MRKNVRHGWGTKVRAKKGLKVRIGLESLSKS